MKQSKISIILTMIKGFKLKYGLYLFLLLISVIITTLSTFMYKILIDVLQFGNSIDYYANVKDPLSLFITDLFGGFDFLKSNLWLFSIFILTLAIGIALSNISRILLRIRIMTGISKQTQLMLFNHIERLYYSHIKTLRNGDIIQTCTRDEETIRRFVVADMHTVFYTLFTVIISFTILCTISWIVALCTICILPLLFIYSFLLIKSVRKRYRATDDSEGLMTARIEENLASVRLVKAYNNEEFETKDFENYISDYKNKYICWRKLSSFFFSSSDVLVFSQIVIATLVAIILCLNGEITSATVVVSFTYATTIVWPVRDVAMTVSNLARVLAALDRIKLILDEPIEDIYDGISPKIEGDIEFKNVSFSFKDSDVPTLQNISFKVKKGQTVAILGKTGSGKTTLAYLLTRLYDINSGEILIDNHNINNISKKHLRENISIVLQEPFLFSKSIKSNLKITSSEISDENMFKASQIAHIHDNILDFKDGYDTQVGEKGITLSGGQKQRIAIARSIISEAPILIFDDSLSAVDTETDIQIRTSLKQRTSLSTTFIITHRVATAKDSDLIIVLEDNTIKEIGTYEQLINQEGLFKRINEIQTKME